LTAAEDASFAITPLECVPRRACSCRSAGREAHRDLVVAIASRIAQRARDRRVLLETWVLLSLVD
jgi:hypothetical protein